MSQAVGNPRVHVACSGLVTPSICTSPPPKKNEPRQKSGETRDRTEQKMKTTLIRSSLCPQPNFVKFSLPGAKEPPVTLRGKIFFSGEARRAKIFSRKKKEKDNVDRMH